MPMLSALALVRDLEAGILRPRDVVEIIAGAVAEREAATLAFAHLDLDTLRQQADAHDGRGALHGLPVAFKDIIDTAHMPTEYGSPIWQGWRPRADAPIVTMTEAAGGLNLGKSATTEFAFLQPAATFNPHDRLATPGGSSAGSAAGVAAGMMPLAFGTQTAGSVIRPAAFCGVTAIKTSFRMLPMVGIKVGAWTLDTLGLFGAGVRDVAFGLEAISGRPLRVDRRDAGTPRFGVNRMAFAGEASAEAEAALALAIAAVERSGARVVEVELPESFVAAHRCHPTLYHYEAGVALAWEIAEHRDRLSPALLDHFAPATAIALEEYDAARGTAKRARREAKAVFGEFDALLTYATPGMAPDRATTGNSAFNRLVTLLGTPALTVPAPSGLARLPLGIQVISAFGQDAKALFAADYVERALKTYA